jgi:hypothetical protein
MSDALHRSIQRSRSMGYAHRFRPTYPDFLYGAPPTFACAAFIKESRMTFTNAIKPDRKSGVRSSERGAPVQFPLTLGEIWGCGGIA